jgi:Zn-dependent protease with chaperone function
MVLYIVLGLRFNSRMRLKSDALAAELTGKTVFLSVLQKIGTAFPKLMTKGRPSITYPPGRPSIQKRIDNLQTTATF